MFTNALDRALSQTSSSATLEASFRLPDARADDRSRTVRLCRERVIIDRNYRGVAMRLSVPVHAYEGVCVALRPVRWGGFGYEIRLEHRDPELSVLLAEVLDDREVWADWRSWAGFFGLPALIERNEGVVAWGHAPGLKRATVAPPGGKTQRRLKRRRAAFVRRRFVPVGVRGIVHRETEIIAPE